MKKQLVIIGTVAILVSVGLSGCTNNPLDVERNKFIGTWMGQSSLDSITCFSDGTFTGGAGLFTGSGTWEIKDGKFVISIGTNQLLMAWNYVFSNADTTLTLISVSGGSPSVYTKQ
jgi:hypothetical protein